MPCPSMKATMSSLVDARLSKCMESGFMDGGPQCIRSSPAVWRSRSSQEGGFDEKSCADNCRHFGRLKVGTGAGAVLVQRHYRGVEDRHSVAEPAHSASLSFLLWGEPGRRFRFLSVPILSWRGGSGLFLVLML